MSTNPAAEYAAAIDTQIAELEKAKARTRHELDGLANQIYWEAGATATRDRRGRIQSWSLSFTEACDALMEAGKFNTLDKYEELSQTFDNQADAIAELREIYLQHRWSRFYVVDNSNGHIHSSTGCTTCYPTTVFRWVTSLSGQTEAEAVAELGEILCSVCFPSAPVAWREGESKATKEARAEREAKKAARAAKKVEKALLPEDPDGGYLTRSEGRGSGDRITTVYAAKVWLKSYYEWQEWNGGHPSYLTEDAERIAELLVGRPGVKQDTAEAVLADAKKRAQKG